MKVIIFAALFAAVAANVAYPAPAYPAPAYPAPAYPAPAYPAPAYPTPAYTAPAYPAAYQKSPEYAPMPYEFAWAVKDDASYNDYAHQESSDGKGYVTGSYRVLLPDGRMQTVNYKADDYTGYVADVKYTGEAKYPEYKPAYKAAYPAPAYPAPAYPTPAYPAPAYPAPAYPAPAYPAPAYPAPAYPAPAYPAPAYPKY
ncbi:hypothetical protein GHT06_012631 [Daphnia sinensis]|uniref:Cuticle protein n=1 Tax=Daphnia sinensis TaxID=1820382 RepID=A0AAD5LFC1_9CRUS|nr:hypothetical protein GHT06_012631 [Daphnia sinensis]